MNRKEIEWEKLVQKTEVTVMQMRRNDFKVSAGRIWKCKRERLHSFDSRAFSRARWEFRYIRQEDGVKT